MVCFIINNDNRVRTKSNAKDSLFQLGSSISIFCTEKNNGSFTLWCGKVGEESSTG